MYCVTVLRTFEAMEVDFQRSSSRVARKVRVSQGMLRLPSFNSKESKLCV